MRTLFFAESGGFASDILSRIVRAVKRDKSPRLMGAEGSQYPNK